MDERPLPTRIVSKELDRAMAMGTILDYRFAISSGGQRRWLLIFPGGERREMGVGEVAAFIDGIAAAEAAREEAIG